MISLLFIISVYNCFLFIADNFLLSFTPFIVVFCLTIQAATTRGFGLDEFKKVGELITQVIKGLSEDSEDNGKIENEVRSKVIELCAKFPIYNHLIKN